MRGGRMHGMAWTRAKGIINSHPPVYASPACESCPRGPLQPAAGLAGSRWIIIMCVMVATAHSCMCLYLRLSM